MKRSLLTVLAILMLGMTIGIIYFSSTRADAATATAADCARIKERNPNVTCIPGVTPFSGADASLTGKTCDFPGDAKTYLQTRNNKDASHVRGLAENFACCLAKFVRAGEAAGHNIRIQSGYRSPQYQQALFRRAVAKYGSERTARKWVAPPGRSNHGRGVAVDLTAAGRSWQHANARRFGLRFRMSWEPWHIEPVPGGSCSGGVMSTSDQYGDPMRLNLENQPYASLMSGQSQPGLEGGGGGSASGGGPITGPFDQIYDPTEYGGDAGPSQDDLEFTGDGVPEFDGLLGEFGQYGEGGEVRDILGYKGATSTATATPRTRTTTGTDGIATPDAATCKNGITKRNIYGDIICVRNTASASTRGAETQPVDTRAVYAPRVQGNRERVTQALTAFARQITPIRYLVGDREVPGASSDAGYVFQERNVRVIDAYQPASSTAYGINPTPPITKEAFIAWLIAQDVIEDDPATAETLSVLLGALRQMLLRTALLLFGTGSYAMGPLLNVVSGGGL